MRRGGIILFLLLTLFKLYSYGAPNVVVGSIKNLDILEKPIVDESTRVPFVATIEIKKSEIDELNIRDYIYIQPEMRGNEGISIDRESIKLRWSNVQRLGVKVLTLKKLNSSEKINENIVVEIEGKFLITDRKVFSRAYSNIFIGSIYRDRNIKVADLWLDLENDRLSMIRALKVDVEKNMYLGKAVAGEALSTERFGGYPAVIDIEALKNSKLKVTIPKEVTIKSNKAGALDLKVKLKFIGADSTIKGKKLEREVVTDSSGKADNIMIGGETDKTTKNHYGRYKGEFVVRVEYVE